MYGYEADQERENLLQILNFFTVTTPILILPINITWCLVSLASTSVDTKYILGAHISYSM